MRDVSEEVETTTITTTFFSKGTLTAGFDKNTGQRFVYDPADHKKIWLNSTDDMYEDAEGSIWKLL